MADDNDYSAPKPSKGDAAHSLAKAGLSALPIAGGAAAELFQLIIQPPLERRRLEWMERIGEGLKKLEEQGLKIEQLQENDQFISTVMQASQAALRTHQAEKLEALKNAVLNVAAQQAPDEALQLMFLNYVDSFTEWHLRILKFFQSPAVPSNISGGGLSHVLENAFPELQGQRSFYDSIWNDLRARDLTNTGSLHVTMTGHGLRQKRTSELGDRFLAFIEVPNLD